MVLAVFLKPHLIQNSFFSLKLVNFALRFSLLRNSLTRIQWIDFLHLSHSISTMKTCLKLRYGGGKKLTLFLQSTKEENYKVPFS